MPLLIYYPAVRAGYFSNGTHIILILRLKKKIHKLYHLKQEIRENAYQKLLLCFQVASTKKK